MNPVDLSKLRRRIAEALGWDDREVGSFSLPTLRDLLRSEHTKIADEVGGVIARGEHVAEHRPRARTLRGPAERKVPT